MFTRTSLITGLLLSSCSVYTFAGTAVSLPLDTAEEPSSPWRLRSGVMWRKTGALSISPDAFGAYTAGLPAFTSHVGEADQDADRTYADGFVNIGAATPNTGLTSYWGYDNSSQVVGDSITFNSTPITTLTSAEAAKTGDSTSAVPYIELAYLVPVNDQLEAGVSLQFAFNGLSSSINSTLDEASVVVSDTYNVPSGFIFPSPGYVGTFPGPGPLINNQPDSRTAVSTPIQSYAYQFEADTDVYSLALGAELQWQPKGSVYVGFSSGLVINYVDWSASWSAPTFSGSSASQASFGDDGDDILYGFYSKANIGYQLDENWSLEGFFRYDWTESLEERVSTTAFDVNLSGWSGGVGVTYRF
ncbi:hypothetical protein SAMN02745181_1585 [Rubritalea squalenifaciens DSM 18772]|uniref:Outer membrane protein beta-barrel domain-containing protein n=1 Tax=Rubritalea squalenifaciens DSM 18772 TaxID=1123071 RepID=A0A1M6HVB6_9BACT|nr:TonB-dependent receptor [Rubritalea squalenifaciens]SHJ26140.1 hypothetical protein SAMN02745181_1585 [Rubritalea squalenifaciens DSM 18772]